MTTPYENEKFPRPDQHIREGLTGPVRRVARSKCWDENSKSKDRLKSLDKQETPLKHIWAHTRVACCELPQRPFVLGHRQGQEYAQTDGGERLISLQFSWGAEKKDVSSIFIGTSPEFELALYTLCFIAGAEENIVTIAGYEVKIRCAAFPFMVSIAVYDLTGNAHLMVRIQKTCQPE